RWGASASRSSSRSSWAPAAGCSWIAGSAPDTLDSSSASSSASPPGSSPSSAPRSPSSKLADDLIARLQRRAIWSCAAMSVAALVLTRSVWAAAAVVGGGPLIGISLVSLQGGVEHVSARRGGGVAGLEMGGRCALLGFLAYVMIARLRLPPLGLIAGASSVMAAAALEAIGVALKKSAAGLPGKKP